MIWTNTAAHLTRSERKRYMEHVRTVTHTSTVTIPIGWLIFGVLLVIAVIGLTACRLGHGHR